MATVYGGAEPERVAVASFNETDRSFLDWFDTHPELNDFANARAAEIYAMWSDMHAQYKPLPEIDTDGQLLFQLKKMVGLFTRLGDFADSLNDYEFGHMFATSCVITARRGTTLAETLDEFVATADTIHMPDLTRAPIVDWNEVPSSIKFWMVLSRYLATPSTPGPDVPTQVPRAS